MFLTSDFLLAVYSLWSNSGNIYTVMLVMYVMSAVDGAAFQQISIVDRRGWSVPGHSQR